MFDKLMRDDLENDWLAREMREENFHGCAAHGGSHMEKKLPRKGWDVRQAVRENYEACRPHQGQHAAKKDRQDPHLRRMNSARSAGSAGGLIVLVVVGIVILQLVLGMARAGIAGVFT